MVQMREPNSQISVSDDIQGGLPVFSGTRVPIQVMFDFLEDGYTIEDFVEQHPTVSREQAVAVLEELRGKALEAASG